MSMPSLSNLNGNPLAVVDVETTGRIGGYHEIVQIAIVPLTLDLEVDTNVQPFYHNIQPNFPERAEKKAIGIHGLQLDDLLKNAPTQERVLDYLLEWFSELPLGHSRRLTPIAHNWGFERSFLTPWLEPELMNEIFTPHPRDTMIFCSMLNDRASMMGEPPPFKYVGLKYVCQLLGVELVDAHNALQDSIATAHVYAALMRAALQ
jgi:DNA polymerase III epsilon subunit-like protein